MGKNIIICSLILILSFSLLTLSSTDLKAEQEGQITDQALILNHNNTQTRATLLDNLLGHFVLTREKINADNLKTISLSKFDYIFYLTGNNRIDTRMLAILKKFQGTICLIGPAAVNLYFPENSITIPVGNNNYIEYNEKELTLKNDISITTIKTASSQTTASDLTIETSIYHNQKEYPFIFHRENKWFIPHLDFWDSSQLIFADLLHNILQQEHRRSKKVFIRIEDIHPRSDPEKIKKLADIFISRELPFP